MKTITTLIRSAPFNNVVVAEGLRMSVGLLLSDNKVRVVLVEDGVYLLGILQPQIVEAQDINRHLQTLLDFGAEIIVDQKSLKARNDLPPTLDVVIKSREEIAAVLLDCQHVTVI